MIVVHCHAFVILNLKDMVVLLTGSFGSLKCDVSDSPLNYITYNPEYLLMFDIIASGSYMCELSLRATFFIAILGP